MNFQKICNIKIDIDNISIEHQNRISKILNLISKSKVVIDSHIHLFDIRCINKSYFIIRFLKDIIGLKSGELEEFSESEAYNEVSMCIEGWENEIKKILETDNKVFQNNVSNKKGIIDTIKACKFLSLSNMYSVYNHYIENYSLGEILNIGKANVLLTALTMDLEMGWDVKVPKSLNQQIKELRELSISSPILPFLFCDPRRADFEDTFNNLYSLFNEAFCIEPSFSGVKIYPALGYDPFDYRLWPIYEVCELYSIPVITHCGGETISTDKLDLTIFIGRKNKRMKWKNRKALAYDLNNPKRWEPVLDMFPKLKISFAHFGGSSTWKSCTKVRSNIDPQHRKETIISFMNKYPNVYADFAFNFIEDNIWDNIINVLLYNKRVRERLMFGTDYWVVNPKVNLKLKQNEFIKHLKDSSKSDIDLVDILTFQNPVKFFFESELNRNLNKKLRPSNKIKLI